MPCEKDGLKSRALACDPAGLADPSGPPRTCVVVERWWTRPIHGASAHALVVARLLVQAVRFVGRAHVPGVRDDFLYRGGGLAP